MLRYQRKIDGQEFFYIIGRKRDLTDIRDCYIEPSSGGNGCWFQVNEQVFRSLDVEDDFILTRMSYRVLPLVNQTLQRRLRDRVTE